MQEALFIADVHLDPQCPTVLTHYLTFLTRRACHAKYLYILGDLFEAWIGDDDDEPAYQTVIHALQDLTASQVSIFVMPGNRDFLLGAGFAEASSCQLITDPTVIQLHGTPTLLMHGDTLCTLDNGYQIFRQQVREPRWQQQFLMQPLTQRRSLARQARMQSQIHTQTVTSESMQVTSNAVIAALKTYGVRHLIHGHTHQPAVHELTVDGHNAYRWVVGDWQNGQAVVLSGTSRGYQLITV